MTEREIRTLSSHEVNLLLSEIKTNRHKCLILIMVDAGLRVSEAITLKFANFDFKNKVLNVKSLKKREKAYDFANRKIPLSQRLYLQLADYAAEFDKLDQDTFLFQNPKNPEKHICRDAPLKFLKRLNIKKLNIQDLDCHVLRHTFASALVASGAELHEVATMLGHQSVDTTRIYTHLPQEQLAKTVNAASIRNGFKVGFFDFLKVKRPPTIYIPNQKTHPVIGRSSELTTISGHLSQGTNVIIFGAHGTGKRLLLDSIKSDRTILTFDDSGSIKISLVYMLLYLYENDKDKMTNLMFKNFDKTQQETRLSRQSIKYLCDEIKSLVQPKEFILKIRQFDNVTRQSLKVIEALKETFIILTSATEISIDKAPFFGNFEMIEIKNLNRHQSFELIHKLSHDLVIEDYEIYRNHIWQQTDGNPKAITEMVDRYRREPRIVTDIIRKVTHFGAIREWDCTYGLIILIGGLAVMRYMTSELENPGLRTIGGLAMITLLLFRAFAARTKRRLI